MTTPDYTSDDVRGWLLDFDTWERVAERIGKHPFTYDLDDSSHRLDVVQIVCEALAKGLITGEEGAP